MEMRTLLLASTLLLSTSAVAGDISPVGCFGNLWKGKNPEMVRLHVEKTSGEQKKFWTWAFTLDVRLPGNKVLRAVGNCDDPRHYTSRHDPLSARCYVSPAKKLGESADNGVFYFTPHGASSKIEISELQMKPWTAGGRGKSDPVFGRAEKVSLGKLDDFKTFKLEEMDDWVCGPLRPGERRL
jgi:hypothetical protein